MSAMMMAFWAGVGVTLTIELIGCALIAWLNR
jgi:hypothetical protein